MTETTFFITGASGFLGTYLCRELGPRYRVYAARNTHPVTGPECTDIRLDITDEHAVQSCIGRIAPDIIIHTAAVSHPDICEHDKEKAWSVNAAGTRHIAGAAESVGCRLVYISSDMVFSGQRGRYSENDIPEPVNYYGATKLEAERICRSICSDTVVIRITLQYGAGAASPSFSDWIISRIRQGRSVPLFTDQFRSPTHIADTACGILQASLSAVPGSLFHLSAPDRIDRYTFAAKLASAFGLQQDLLVKTSMHDVSCTAPRPEDVSLNGDLFVRTFNFQPRSVSDGVAALAAEAV